MGWETRKRGGRYYTRSHKVLGKVARQYIGIGAGADLAARLDALERERRADERATLRLVRDTLVADEAPILAMHQTVDILTRGALLAAGCYRHHGQWRRKRA